LKRQGAIGKPGEVVNSKGEVIGKHEGLALYAVGQRKGIQDTRNNPSVAGQETNKKEPWYVIGKDVENNRLVVGRREETGRKEIIIGEVNWINPESGIRNIESGLKIRIRHGGELIPVRRIQETRNKDTNVKVVLEKEAYGVSPGQAAVIYEKLQDTRDKKQTETYEVVGGGTIVN